MPIRTKIAVFVLLIGVAEAVLLGFIGYRSVSKVFRNTTEMREISAAIEGARSLNSTLIKLADPVDMIIRGREDAVERFDAVARDLERRVATCSATACHERPERSHEMAESFMGRLRAIHEDGRRILMENASDKSVSLTDWLTVVDDRAHQLAQATERMSEILLARAVYLDETARRTEREAVVELGFATLFFVLVAGVLCYPLTVRITRGLETLTERSRSIASGDLSVRVTQEGPREIVQLAQSFNRMADELTRHQDQLLSQKDLLEHEVQNRLIELRRKDEELRRSERLAGIGLIAGTVAHDLNSPLTSILLNAEGFLETAPPGTEQRRLLENILRDAQRCRQIAGDIRALGRVGKVRMAPCSIGQVVEEAVRLLRFKWQPKEVRIRMMEQGEVVGCECSSQRLLQVFMNLIDNAVDASPPGGEVDVRIRNEDSAVIVEVEDRGEGIAPEHREAIFKPLYTTKSNGTGLGLAVSRLVVEQHDGRIEFSTRTAREAGPDGSSGTVFRVSLPAGPRKKGESSDAGGSCC